MTPRTSRAALGAALAAALAAAALPALPTTATASAASAPAEATAPASAGAAAEAFVPSTLTLHGGRQHQELGHRLNLRPCDLDGDGLGDVTAVGAAALGGRPFLDMAALRRTRGHADALTDLPQWTPFTTDGTAGWTCAGDVNGDGFDDLVQVPAAAARVVSVNHSAGRTNEAGRLVEHRVRNYTFPVGTRDLARTTAGPAGDVDGDGIGDVVVSQHTASTRGRATNGRLWVLAGSPAVTDPGAPTAVTVTGEADPADRVALVVEGANDGDRLDVVAPLGDVDGDGIDDVAVASAAAGTVWLLHGRPRGATTRVVDLADLDPADGRVLATQRGGTPGTALGASLASGDVDGDGVTDVVIGLGADLGSDGAVAVVLGGDTAPAVVDLDRRMVSDTAGSRGYLVTPERSGDALGHSVAVLDDLDGDGRDDLLVGAPGHDPVDATTGERIQDAGAAYVLAGGSGGEAQALTAFAASATTSFGHRVDGARGVEQGAGVASRFGLRVAALGDVDGNGAADFAVAAPGRSDHPTYRQGAVTVALRGELASTLDLVVSRRVGDDGTPLPAEGAVVAASDVLDLRARLRLATLQGVAGDVDLTLDGEPLADCAGLDAVVEAPHRSFASCHGVRVPEVGEHTLAATSAGVAGQRSPATATGTRLLVTDATRTRAEGVGQDRRSVRVEVRTATADVPVGAGTVEARAADGSLVAADLALSDGAVVVPLPEGVSATGVQVSYAGVRTRVADRDVALLAPSTATVEPARAPGATVVVSPRTVRHGDAATATLTLDRELTGRAELLLDDEVVATTVLSGRRTTLTLPRRLGVGRHRVAVRTVDTGEVPSATATASLRVRRAVVGALRATAPRFDAGTRPRVTVRIGRAGDGARPAGRVTVRAGGRHTSVAVGAGTRRVVLRLPALRRATRAVVSFSPRSDVYAAPRPLALRLRPRA